MSTCTRKVLTALIETETTTVLVGAGDRATITATSWIDIVVG